MSDFDPSQQTPDPPPSTPPVHPPDSAPHPKRLFRLIYKFILISIAVHFVGLAVFGGFVVMKKYLPEEVTFVSPPPMQRVEPKKRQYKLRVKQQQKRSSRPKLQQRLQSTRMSSVALPEVKTKITPVKQKTSNLPGMSEGLGDGLGFGGGTGGGMIFGVNVVANKLGVILDVSFSTHDVIHLAVDEIQKAFPTAIIVLVPGAGMKTKDVTEVYPAKEFEKNKQKFDLGYEVKLEITDFLYGRKGSKGLLAKNRNFKRLYDKAMRQKRLYIVRLKNTGSGGNAIGGTEAAFEFLVKEGVDGIYWFADFADGIDKGSSANVLRRLRIKKIKVYQHILAGKDAKPVPQERLVFADKTDGEVIRAEVK